MQGSRAARNASFTHPFIQERLTELGFLFVFSRAGYWDVEKKKKKGNVKYIINESIITNCNCQYEVL